MIKELTEEPVKMQSCYHCGHEWQHGSHGGHNCFNVLKNNVLKAIGELERKERLSLIASSDLHFDEAARHYYKRMAIECGVQIKELTSYVDPRGSNAKQG